MANHVSIPPILYSQKFIDYGSKHINPYLIPAYLKTLPKHLSKHQL